MTFSLWQRVFIIDFRIIWLARLIWFVWLVWLVWFNWLVWLVWFVWFVWFLLVWLVWNDGIDTNNASGCW